MLTDEQRTLPERLKGNYEQGGGFDTRYFGDDFFIPAINLEASAEIKRLRLLIFELDHLVACLPNKNSAVAQRLQDVLLEEIPDNSERWGYLK